MNVVETQRKNDVESEISDQYELLQANGVDLDSPLTDNSGFPRDDIPDLASVRVARARVHELRNDLRTIVDQLAQTLPLILVRTDSETRGKETKETLKPTTLQPFAKVNSVSVGSPAESAGLQISDQIIKFGTINATNHDHLKALATCTLQSEGQELDLICFRFDEDGKRKMVSKTLIPRSDWGGRGLLGSVIHQLDR